MGAAGTSFIWICVGMSLRLPVSAFVLFALHGWYELASDFSFGTVPHGGFGLGFERLIQVRVAASLGLERLLGLHRCITGGVC